ncbi:trimeric intracellular cation channel family protein [Maribellus sp. CM-23]|uniref:trimeric intracellular cation channel family protein n=1 Tax=Maribellus sp. CM-23 TaxID=2781026 RepID=UPI001F36FAE9|nr:trimeric intracellular cation channel family protein [Maribellus sp. CM-23]MCE4565267.1 trimeric intracellular cation channel family protein [Maribellus sp. CM-23]
METLLQYINIAGTFAFAISGSLTAMKKKLDPFGILILAFVTSVGGGTIRDMLIEKRTAFWLVELEYLYVIVAGTIFAILFRKKLSYLRKTIMLFDSAGLGLFTIAGVEIALQHGFSDVSCIILGTITGSFGGVIRDIFANEVPVIFRKEIYATVTVLGGICYLLLRKMGFDFILVQLIPVLMIIVLRILAVYYKWSLPLIIVDENEGSERS